MINYITNWTLKQQRKKWALKQPKKKPTTCQPSIVFYIYLPGRTASADWLIYVIHVINQIKSNNFIDLKIQTKDYHQYRTWQTQQRQL